MHRKFSALYIISMTIFILIALIFILNAPAPKNDIGVHIKKDSVYLNQFTVEDSQPYASVPTASYSPAVTNLFYNYYDKVNDALDRKISGTSKNT